MHAPRRLSGTGACDNTKSISLPLPRLSLGSSNNSRYHGHSFRIHALHWQFYSKTKHTHTYIPSASISFTKTHPHAPNRIIRIPTIHYTTIDSYIHLSIITVVFRFGSCHIPTIFIFSKNHFFLSSRVKELATRYFVFLVVRHGREIMTLHHRPWVIHQK